MFGYICRFAWVWSHKLVIAHPLSPRDLFIDKGKLTRSVPLLLVDRESTSFLGIRLGAKESRDLSRQRGLTIGLG